MTDNFSTIVSKADYINGKRFTGQVEHLKVDPEMYQNFVNKLEMYDEARSLFYCLESHSDFFKYASDFAKWFPKPLWKELFYAARNGFYSADVPADCIYLVKKAYAVIDLPNLIFKQIPTAYLNTWFSEGYLSGGYTLRDVVCTYCCSTYKPLDEVSTKIKHKDFTEIYVRSTDMVAAVPSRLGDFLSADVIDKLECSPMGLHVNGAYIRTMAGFYGAVNSNYDLRKLC